MGRCAGAGWGKVQLEIRHAGESSSGRLREELERLKTVIASSLPLLADGVKTVGEAIHVLGFPGTDPDMGEICSRFRTLAAIHHPDSGHGSHQRMAQLNQAIELLRRRDY